MAVTITRTNWIDDDGSGTTGTVLNNAMKTGLYNEIDTALAKVPQLVGGNAFNGTQTIQGVVTITGFGTHSIGIGSGVGTQLVQIANPLAGTGNVAQLTLGNDLGPIASVAAFSSTYTPSGPNVANGTTFSGNGSGGLSIVSAASASLRFFTANLERLRVMPTGELVLNSLTNTFAAQLLIVTDLASHIGAVIQNTNAGNSGNFQLFVNSAGTVAGNIAQSGAASVAYGTTSDARLKDDDGRASDLSALRAVVVHDFTWKADGIRDRGVFAQEAADVFPRAITKGTDERADDGNLKQPWMTDYSKFVADLIVGWQQHDQDIAALRAALADRT